MSADWLPAGMTPFAGISALGILAVAAVHFFGCFIRGAFGFGSNMPIVLLSTWILGPHHAILLAVMSTLVAQAHLLPQGMRSADWPVAKPLIAGLLIGIVGGTWMFTRIAPDWLTLILGALIGALVAMDRLKALERLSTVVDVRSRPITTGLAITSATVGTVSGGGALYFLVTYLKLACRTPAELRGTNVMLSTVFTVGRTASLAVAGMITPTLLVEGVLIAPIVLAGSWIGSRAFHRASADRFYLGIQILLLLAAGALIVRGVIRVF